MTAQAAAAQSYCVAPNTTCGGTNVASFQDALDQSAVWDNNDSIYLGAATYTAPAGGYKYTAPLSPVAIFGLRCPSARKTTSPVTAITYSPRNSFAFA